MTAGNQTAFFDFLTGQRTINVTTSTMNEPLLQFHWIPDKEFIHTGGKMGSFECSFLSSTRGKVFYASIFNPYPRGSTAISTPEGTVGASDLKLVPLGTRHLFC